MNEARFRAMGSNAHVIVVGGDARALDRVRRRIDELEHRWSRFLATSEISALNAAHGRPRRVSRDTALLVVNAIEGMRITGGSFDPTVLGAVVRAGYDHSFEDVDDDVAGAFRALQAGCEAIEVDDDVVRLPAGVGFDPGGIGKGLAADLVSDEAIADGAAGICINLGGDVRVAGEAPAGDSWTVAIHHPTQIEPIALVGLVHGAVATSTTLLRAWHVDGDHRHHIIDPATGAPSDTDLTLASVISARGWTSEILAKAVLLRGARHPFDLLGGTPADALAIDTGGRIHTTPGFASFLGDAHVPAALHITEALP
jgi:thiamine biosynthesis lipoprotein